MSLENVRAEQLIRLPGPFGNNVIFQGPQGNTALHTVASSGTLELVILSLRRGANISAPNKSGNTPLMLATMAKKLPVIELLLNFPNVDVYHTNVAGKTALQMAVETQDFNIIRAFAYEGDNRISALQPLLSPNTLEELKKIEDSSEKMDTDNTNCFM